MRRRRSLANDTPYGLAAYLHTGDGLRAARVTRRLRAGLISVNGGYPDVDVPFGGAKQSGNGRENGFWLPRIHRLGNR